MVCLVVPGSSERMLAKARSAEVGEIVIDLEDAVTPERKPEALAATLEALAAGGFRARRVSVRINSVETGWSESELTALSQTATPPASIVLPKADTASLQQADALLPTDSPIRLQALIETAEGLAGVEQAAAAAPGRLEALLIGYADLAVSLGRTSAGAANLDLWLAVQDRVLAAAHAKGLRAIDGPYLGLDDPDGLTRSAQRATELGFDDKWAIHPAQIDPIRTAFAPEPAEVERAKAVLEAMETGQREGAGAVRFEGRMLDEPVRLAALRTLARAEQGTTV